MVSFNAKPKQRRWVTRWAIALALAFGSVGAPASFGKEPGQPENRRSGPPAGRGRHGEGPGADALDHGGHPGDGWMGGRRDVSWEKMPEVERAKLLEFVKEHFPRMFVELERLRDASPQRYDFRMNRFAPELANLMDLSRQRPELAALMIRERRADMEMHLLSMRSRNAETDEEKARIRERMTQLAGDLFDARHERRAMMIRDLDSRLAEMKQRHGQAEQMRAKLIEQEVRDRLDRERPFRRRLHGQGPPDEAPPAAEERP